jgi:hypothetical protein
VGTAHPLYQESRYAAASVNCFCFLHLYITVSGIILFVAVSMTY